MPSEKETKRRSRDTGMAVVLGLLGWSWLAHSLVPVPWAITALLITMIAPSVYRPLALVWFALAEIMGRIASAVILSVLFFLVLSTMGGIRRLTGADPMHLKRWKSGTGSVFHYRDHRFEPGDLDDPF